MKVYISTDFEGVSGIVAWDQIIGSGPERPHAAELLLRETNAAIEGAASAGATEFTVNDAHSVMRNLDHSRLSGRASYNSGRFKPLYMMQGLDETYDAVFLIGYHGSAGAASILSHTYSPQVVWEARLNGRVVGESGINALVAQHYGVPIVLVTGDQLTIEEARPFNPALHSVVTKFSVGRLAAENLHPDNVCEQLRDAAKLAIKDRKGNKTPICHIETPATLEIVFLVEDMAETATWIEGVRRTGPRTAAFTDTNLLALYRRFVAVLYLARSVVDP